MKSVKSLGLAVVTGATMMIAGIAVWQSTFAGAPIPRTLAAAVTAPAAAPTRATNAAQRFTIDQNASEASYHVGETFFENNEFKVAVGVTHGIQGDVFLDRAQPDQSHVGPITVNVNQFTSDSSRRDNAIRRRWLESSKYPTAVFTPVSIEGLPKTYTAGQTVRVRISGNLKVHDVTKPAVFAGTIRLSGDMLTGDMESTVLMTDFGFDPPSIMMLKTENKATLVFHFTARPAGG